MCSPFVELCQISVCPDLMALLSGGLSVVLVLDVGMLWNFGVLLLRPVPIGFGSWENAESPLL